MAAENKSEAELMMEEADKCAEGARYLEAVQLYRKAMDTFPPFDEQKMHDVFLKLTVFYARAQMQSSALTGAKKTTASITLSKVFARMALYAACLDPVEKSQSALSVAKATMDDLKALGERPARHADLFLTYAGALEMTGDIKKAEDNFIKAMNYGADPKKVFYSLMVTYAKIAQYSEGAKVRALHYLEAFRKVAADDQAAIDFAWPLARWLQSTRDEPPPTPPRL